MWLYNSGLLVLHWVYFLVWTALLLPSDLRPPAALSVMNKIAEETKAIRCISVVTGDKCNNCLLSCVTVVTESLGASEQNGKSSAHPGRQLDIAVSLETSKGCLCPTVLIMSPCLLHT